MEKYIRVSDAVQTVMEKPDMTPDEKAGIIRRLKAVSAADVVAVVRCADCKYDERCMFQSFVRDERVEPYDKTVFFCADGKRKDGGQHDGD